MSPQSALQPSQPQLGDDLPPRRVRFGERDPAFMYRPRPGCARRRATGQTALCRVPGLDAPMVNDNRPLDLPLTRARWLAEAADLRAAAKLADHPRRARTLRRLARMTHAAPTLLARLNGRRPD